MFFFFAWWNRYKLYHDFICVDSVPIFVAYLSKEIHSSQRCFSDFLEWLIWESFGISISVLLQVAILNPSKSKVLEAKFCIFANCPTNSPLFDSGKTGPRPRFCGQQKQHSLLRRASKVVRCVKMAWSCWSCTSHAWAASRSSHKANAWDHGWDGDEKKCNFMVISWNWTWGLNGSTNKNGGLMGFDAI